MEKQSNLREQLTRAKDLSELMIDMAYGGLYSNSKELAEEVLELSEDLDEMINDMRIRCVMSARSPQDARDIATVLHLLSSMDLVSKGAEGIARIVEHKLELPPSFVNELSNAFEILNKVVVKEEYFLSGKKLEEVSLPKDFGVRVIAIRRIGKWLCHVDGETVLLEDDVVLFAGSREHIDELRVALELPEIVIAQFEHEQDGVQKAVRLLIDMKDASELSVGLAYSSFLFNDKNLAAVVDSIDEKMSRKRERVETWVLDSAFESQSPLHLRGLLHLAEASETICEACADMVSIVLEDEIIHPVIAQAMEDTNEVMVKVEVKDGAEAVGSFIDEHHSSFVAMTHIRNGKYLYDLSKPRKIEVGDVVIARGPIEAREAFEYWLNAGHEDEED